MQSKIIGDIEVLFFAGGAPAVHEKRGQELERPDAAGCAGFPFFGELIRDCLDRTDKAYSQKMFFKAIELAITAQEISVRVE